MNKTEKLIKVFDFIAEYLSETQPENTTKESVSKPDEMEVTNKSDDSLKRAYTLMKKLDERDKQNAIVTTEVKKATESIKEEMERLKKEHESKVKIATEEEIKELRKLGFVPRDNRALFRPKKEASEGAKKSAEKLKQFHSTTGMSVRGEDVDKKAKGGFIKKAIKKPGALRSSLGVKKGEKIPAAKLAKAAKASGKMGQRARLAKTLKGFKK
jgi:isoleucyl-tRNA synthetase